MLKEVSSGGLVHREGSVLLVKVRNLEGRVLWTFPKGHLEKGETPRQAALREVEEETGWRCAVQRTLTTARYRFKRGEREVDKRVLWYLMEPLEKVGVPDADEILKAEWATVSAARKRLRYPSDKKLFEAFRTLSAKPGRARA